MGPHRRSFTFLLDVYIYIYIYVQIFKIQTGREKGGGAGRDGDTKDLCETTFYACNITIHRTRRQAVQHKIHSNSPDSIMVNIYIYMSMAVDERHRIGVDTFSPFKIGEAPVT